MKNNVGHRSGAVKIAPDLAGMIAAIKLCNPAVTAASILDPLIRPELERRYAALPAHVRKTVESRARKAAEKKQPA